MYLSVVLTKFFIFLQFPQCYRKSNLIKLNFLVPLWTEKIKRFVWFAEYIFSFINRILKILNQFCYFNGKILHMYEKQFFSIANGHTCTHNSFYYIDYERKLRIMLSIAAYYKYMIILAWLIIFPISTFNERLN